MPASLFLLRWFCRLGLPLCSPLASAYRPLASFRRCGSCWLISSSLSLSLYPSLSLLQSVFAVLTSSPCPPPASGCRSLAPFRRCGSRRHLTHSLAVPVLAVFFASAPCSLPAIGYRSLASSLALRPVLVSLSREAAQLAAFVPTLSAAAPRRLLPALRLVPVSLLCFLHGLVPP